MVDRGGIGERSSQQSDKRTEMSTQGDCIVRVSAHHPSEKALRSW